MWKSLLIAALVLGGSAAQAQGVKVVGIGSSSCMRFKQDIAENPAVERDYFAWAQGFMSGALIRAPKGIDDDLDLSPPSFPLLKQVDFLRAFCADHPDRDYLDAARALYRSMRKPAI